MKLRQGREFDLPPKWDGRIVKWRGWEDVPLTLCRAGDRDVCLDCGSLAPPVINWGMFYPHDGDTWEALVEATTRRTGRTYLKKRTVLEHPHLRFVAYRCPDCRADHVLDTDSQTWWTLDEDDYGPEGSSD